MINERMAYAHNCDRILLSHSLQDETSERLMTAKIHYCLDKIYESIVVGPQLIVRHQIKTSKMD